MARRYLSYDEAQTSGSRVERSAQLLKRSADDQRGRDEVWHVVGAAGEPAFQNGWASNPAEPATRFKRVAGIVYVQARVTGGANATVAFTLPAGYRPNQEVFQICLDGGGSPAFMTVSGLGEVAVSTYSAGGDGKRRANFSFPADQ